jgi:WD40 repeat protein
MVNSTTGNRISPILVLIAFPPLWRYCSILMSRRRLYWSSVCLMVALASAVCAEQSNDLFGDPLPNGAVQRLGTVRLRSGTFMLCAAYSLDGRFLATGGRGGAIIWDAKTGQKIRQFIHKNVDAETCSIAFSPDSKMLATSGYNNDPGLVASGYTSTEVWDVDSAKVLREVQFGSDWGTVLPRDNSVAFSCDNEKLGILCSSEFRMISIKDGTTVLSVDADKKAHNEFSSFAMSPKDGHCALGDRSGKVAVYDIDTGKSNDLQLHSGIAGSGICSLAFSSDGKLLAGCASGGISIWKVDSLQVAADLKAETDKGETFRQHLRHVCFVQHDKAVLATDDYTDIHVLDIDSGKQKGLFRRSHIAFRTAISPDQSKLAIIGYQSNAASVIAVEDGKPSLELDGHTSEILSVALSPNGKTAITGSWDGTARVWDTDTGKSTQFLTTIRSGLSNTGIVNGVSYSPDGSMFVAAVYEGKLLTVDAKTRDKREIEWKGEYIVATVLCVASFGTAAATAAWCGGTRAKTCTDRRTPVLARSL